MCTLVSHMQTNFISILSDTKCMRHTFYNILRKTGNIWSSLKFLKSEATAPHVEQYPSKSYQHHCIDTSNFKISRKSPHLSSMSTIFVTHKDKYTDTLWKVKFLKIIKPCLEHPKTCNHIKNQRLLLFDSNDRHEDLRKQRTLGN